MSCLFRFLLLGVFLCVICSAQKPKFLIVTDMEGVGGVNNADEQLLPGQRRFDESRRLLVGEINAAIQGLLDRHLGGEDVGRKLFSLAALERWAHRFA